MILKLQENLKKLSGGGLRTDNQIKNPSGNASKRVL